MGKVNEVRGPVRYIGFELSSEEYAALQAQAAKELRTVHDQALHILRTALSASATLPADSDRLVSTDT